MVKNGRSLESLQFLRRKIVWAKRTYLRRVWRMDIHPTVEMSLSAKFDRAYPQGVHVGEYSYVAFDARILAHDLTRHLKAHTRVGKNCFIGGSSIVMPGVQIGDSCIVGSGAVVTRDVPSNCVVAGNPAKVIATGIVTERYGFVGRSGLGNGDRTGAARETERE